MAAAGVSVYDNLGNNPEAFGKLLSGEVPDAFILANDADGAQEIAHYLEQNDDVRKSFYYGDNTVLIDDTRTLNWVVEDFGLTEGELLYEGRYPKHDNEIVISGSLSGMIDKAIGDTVRVTQNGGTVDFLVVGFIQSVNNGGICSAMTIEGAYRTQPDYQPRQIYIYLDDSAKTAAFVKTVSEKFGKETAVVTNLYELMDAQLSVYATIFQAVAAVVIAVTLLVILMTLYLVLKTVILRRRRALGIQKALGFTTLQLMNQFALNFVPVIALGVAAGGLCGIAGFNAIFVALCRGMGIMTASMSAPIGMTAVMCVCLVLAAYVFAMLIAWRVRKISAYALVTE
jgi:putative ABC transport system permease protein